MADEKFDVVVIGGGSKALVTALYLQAYGGMNVCIFERMHELGGSWCSLERLAPGFIGDSHSSTMSDWYFLPLLYDFPKFEEYGGKFFGYKVGLGQVIKDDLENSLLIYSYFEDPTGEKSAKEIARYSERDAETFLKFDDMHFREGRREAQLETIFSMVPPPDQPDPLERWYRDYMKRSDAILDPQIMMMSMIDSGRALFERVEYRALMTSVIARMDINPMKPMGGGGWFIAQGRRENNRVVGGTHNIAHAVIRLFVEHGGKFYSRKEVDKIIIENGTAKGIRLADGTEIGGRIVVSGQDPYQLAFRLIGKEHLERKVWMKVGALDRSENMINWYTFALHEIPHYTAAARNPDIDTAQWVHIAVKDDAQMAKEACLRYAGLEPPCPQVRACPTNSDIDPTRQPEGKATLLVETLTLPKTLRTEREWLKYKMDMAKHMINEIHLAAPNITWDSVIGVDTNGPYDIGNRHLNMSTGNQLVVDPNPATKGKFAPIIEWARHRIPGIKNLYATGSAWSSFHSAYCGQGYKCYKAIAEDFKLRKPWEEKGRPW
ncbi:MAG: NAD(P)/FAD-dependent oxidoreductase [Desulfobacteraceae bacterium]|nr:MAG: NAD(P)/FAD-dependent oxidoreductase [Desulfobacteraceae bacterium]